MHEKESPDSIINEESAFITKEKKEIVPETVADVIKPKTQNLREALAVVAARISKKKNNSELYYTHQM